MKNSLNLKLLGEPIARELLWIRLERRTKDSAYDAARQLLPQAAAVLGPTEVQGDLPIVKPMIVGEPTQKQRMNHLMNQVW